MADKALLALLILLLAEDRAKASNDPVTITAWSNSRSPLHLENGHCQHVHDSMWLNLRDVGLQRIDSNFSDSPYVSCLSLENNEIAYVSPSAFQLMPNLLYLNLAQNKLSLSNFSHLHGHPHLRTLILDDNNPPSDESEIFKLENKFPRLMYLYLRGNDLKDLSSLTFAPKLTHLYLSSNNLGESELSFLDDSSVNLIGLDLANNKIHSLNASKLASVQDLMLDGNQIKRLCGKSYCRDSALVLEGATKLHRLSLAKNGITGVESDAFDETPDLIYLNVSHNEIESIRKNTFEHAKKLINLTLEGNSLTEMPDLYGLDALEHLSLASNRLEIVGNDSFSSNLELRSIHLSSNKISTIEASAFKKLIYLEFLHLSNNKLVSFPSTWLDSLIVLKVLYVDGNRLRKLDDLQLGSVRSPAKLNRVHLQNNLITKFHTSSLYYLFKSVPNVTLEFFDVDNLLNVRQQVSSNTEICKCDCDENNDV